MSETTNQNPEIANENDNLELSAELKAFFKDVEIKNALISIVFHIVF